MSFFKSLVIAIIATVLLSYLVGTSFHELLGIHLDKSENINEKLIEPIKTLSLSALMYGVLFMATLVFLISVLGSVFFILLLGGSAVFLFMVGSLWPILLIVVVFWLVTGNNHTMHKARD